MPRHALYKHFLIWFNVKKLLMRCWQLVENDYIQCQTISCLFGTHFNSLCFLGFLDASSELAVISILVRIEFRCWYFADGIYDNKSMDFAGYIKIWYFSLCFHLQRIIIGKVALNSMKSNQFSIDSEAYVKNVSLKSRF